MKGQKGDERVYHDERISNSKYPYVQQNDKCNKGEMASMTIILKENITLERLGFSDTI